MYSIVGLIYKCNIYAVSLFPEKVAGANFFVLSFGKYTSNSSLIFMNNFANEMKKSLCQDKVAQYTFTTGSKLYYIYILFISL